MPNAAWSWEFLRRNLDYIRDFNISRRGLPKLIKLNTGGHLLRTSRRDVLAEKWGLVSLAEPKLEATKANVFWHPSVFPSALQISLSPILPDGLGMAGKSIIDLKALATRRISLEAVDGTRYILLCGRRFWIQLYCENCKLVGESAHLGFEFDSQVELAPRRLDTAAQLLSLYRSSGRKLALIGRKKNAKPLADALTALDIHAGGGDSRDISIALEGSDRVEADWISSGCYLKERARRALRRGNEYVSGKYLELLTKKCL